MGNEYKLTFRHNNLTELDLFLRGLPNFEKCDRDWSSYLYRLPNNSGKMPNAHIQIEDDGLYFNDMGMPPNAVDVLQEQVRQKYGEVNVDEYEP